MRAERVDERRDALHEAQRALQRGGRLLREPEHEVARRAQPGRLGPLERPDDVVGR